MGFLETLQSDTNKTSRTENGALTNASSLSATLDFFSLAGAMRERKEAAYDLFQRAYAEDPLVAVRTLFYLRDVRGGQGERELFRYIFNKLPQNVKNKLSEYVEEYGRWDDVDFTAVNSELIHKQLEDDMSKATRGESISLLAKWLPSVNSSSKKSRESALKLAKALGMSERNYRKTLSSLRKHLDLLESKMSARQWSEIDYSKLPTQAHRKHIKAFKRHDESRYENYLASVEKGEAKINSATAYTYEIYDMVMAGQSYWNSTPPDETTVRTATAMWNALPDYTNGANALVLADVSGSMEGRPMSISVSLATYFAERNKGTFNGYYVTFSAQPKVQQIPKNGNIFDKFNTVQRTDVGYNTDLQAAFRAILNAAVKDDTAQEDMPKVLYIISDMEFDDQMSNCGETNFDTAQREFKQAGYELPHVVFWNVNARQNQSPATKFDNRVTLISGSSQSTFQYAVTGKTPLESMLDIVNSERYEKITL